MIEVSAESYLQALLLIRDNLDAMNKLGLPWYPERETLADFFEDMTGLSAQAVSLHTDDDVKDSVSWT